MPLTSFDKNHLYKSDKWKFMRTLVDLQTKIDALVDSNYYSFVFSAYWEAVTTWFHSTGCYEFALSKIILHVYIQNGWIWKPFTIFSASNITLKWQKSTEHNNSELENSSSPEKNVSLLPLTWSWSCLYFFWLLVMVAEMLQYSISYYNFMFNVRTFVFGKPQFYSVLCICIQ